jgi:hypothetical protein
MGAFDEILKTIPEADQAVLNRYPALKASMVKLEDDLATVAPFAQYGMQMQDWSKQNWDEQAGMTRAEKQLRDELTAAQAKLATAGAAGAAPDQIAALRAEMDNKVKAVENSALAAINGMDRFYSVTAKHAFAHKDEFGENLDPQKLMSFITQNKLTDPDAAYDRMVADQRAANAAKAKTDLETKHAADIAAAEQRGRDLAATERAMGPGGMLPTDQSGGIAGVTARIDKPVAMSEATTKAATDAKLGDGSLAALGYAAFQRGEFSAPVQ